MCLKRLQKDEIREIAKRLLENLKQRTASLDITVDFSDEAVDKIADAGFDEVYGARPLKRAIQSKIEDALSEEMLKGNVQAKKRYLCTVDGDAFVFRDTATQQPAAEANSTTE